MDFRGGDWFARQTCNTILNPLTETACIQPSLLRPSILKQGYCVATLSTIAIRDELFENHAEDEATFGPPGTIGFELLATDDFDLIGTPRETFSIRDERLRKPNSFC